MATVDVVEDRALDEFERVKKGELLAAVYKLSDDERSFVVDRTLSSRSPFSAFAPLLPQNDIRWAVVNMKYTCGGGGQRSKMVFISWAPDNLHRASLRESARLKMAAITAHGPFLARVGKGSFSAVMQANGPDDIELSVLMRKVSRFEREPIDPSSIDAFSIGAL